MYQSLKDFMQLPTDVRQVKQYEMFVRQCKNYLLTL